MVLAPLAVLPLGVAAALVVALADLVDLPPLATAYVVLLALALGTRAFHWDGLADTADGLTASYSPERSLEVMRTGPVGPGRRRRGRARQRAAGGRAHRRRPPRARLVGGRPAGLRVARRASPWPACAACRRPGRTGSARPTSARCPVVGAIATLLVAGGRGGLRRRTRSGRRCRRSSGSVMVAAVVALLVRCVRRLGGITGDVLGAAVEVSFAVLVLAAATV